MRYLSLNIAFICAAVLFGGCGPKAVDSKPLVSVKFPDSKTLAYKIVSERSSDLVLESGEGSKADSNKTVERMDIIVEFTPTEVDEFGTTTISAYCRSAKVKRTLASGSSPPTDAVESMAGKKWKFKVNAFGQIEDAESMVEMFSRVSEKSFNRKNSRRTIKDQDMIFDVIESLWFFWDSVASISKPLAGIAAGDSWTSTRSVPFALPLPISRDLTYTVDSIEKTEDAEVAVITSRYAMAKGRPEGLCIPYKGKFQMKGMFGFLRNYQPLSIEGTGTSVFDIKRSLLKKETQRYNLEMNADFLLPLKDTKPVLKIDQTITVELLEE